jgi:hypothetical protein
VDVAADQVLQGVVAVEPTTALPQLREPRPDRLGRGVDRDRPGRGEIGSGDQLVAGKGAGRFLRGRAPAELAAPGEQEVADGGAADREAEQVTGTRGDT